VTALADLAAELRSEGGLIAAAVADPDGADTTVGVRALVVEAIREGYLQHYGDGRVIRTADRDLALLAGDRLYALGLARLAERGDLEAVRVLADLISDCAQAHAEGAPKRADAAWEAATTALRSGHEPEHAI
jgi:hypothetical protein